MSNPFSGQIIRKRLVENITLLWTLTEVPEQPKEHKLSCGNDKARQLSSERERQLADSFAFISASTDDMLRVMAICVEEDPDKMGMTIRLASNTGDLSRITEGFNGIANALERAALRVESRTDIRQNVFRQIVVLDTTRILSRLRSRHAERTRKTAGKPVLLALLRRTINDPSINPQGKVAKAKVAKARLDSIRLSETFDKFEATSDDPAASSLSQDVLMDVLVQAYDFDASSLQIALQSSFSIDPTLKNFLPQAISKLGRYYCIACDLVDAARSSRYTLFGRISIKALKEPEFNTASITDELAYFDETLQRVTRSSHRRYCENYTSGCLSAARTKFQSRLSSRATPWKIHAEIQLLCFYEHSPDIPHPRIICSSKSACYLCDLFIKTHGKFQTPRTHGRLYDKWILPEWPISEAPANEYILPVVEQFNAALEAKILHTLNRKRLPCRHPNESTLPLREPWSSTSTLSRAYTRYSTAEASDHAYDDVFEDQEEPPPQNSAFADTGSFKTALEDSLYTTQTPPVKRDTPKEQQRNGERGAIVIPLRPNAASQRLTRGDWAYHKLTHPCDTFTVQTDVVSLHASWDYKAMEATHGLFAAHNICWVQVKWLGCGSQGTQEDARFGCIDLDTLESNQDKTVESGTVSGAQELYLKKGEHLLLIKYTFEDLGQG